MSYIVSVTPTTGQVVQTSRPIITVNVFFDEAVTTNTKVEYTLTKGLRTITGGGYVYQWLAGSTPRAMPHTFYPQQDLDNGVWTIEVRAYRQDNSNGTWIHLTGSPTASTTFTVSSITTTVLVVPRNNHVEPWVGTNHQLNTGWEFRSTNYSDVSTAHQIIVRRVSDQVVVVDTGKIVQTAPQRTTLGAYITIPAANKDIQLEWSARSWNDQDIPTPYAGYHKVLIGTPPVVTIVDPTNNEVVSNAPIEVQVSGTIPSGRTIKTIEVSLWKGVTRLWGTIRGGTWTNNQVVSISDNSFILEQSTEPYQYRVTMTDDLFLKSSQAVRNFTVAYAAPSLISVAPTVSAQYYQDRGYMRLRWGSESLDLDFYSWIIERAVAPLDPNTGTVGTQEPWEEIGRVYNLATAYEYRDYLAPSNSFVTYRVRQVVIRYGVELVGEPVEVSAGVNAISSSYWLVTGVNQGTMRRVTNLNPNPAIAVDTTGYTAGAVTITRDTAWRPTGSLKLAAQAGSNDTKASIGGDTGAMRLGMEAGKTYTVTADINTPVALTGTLNAWAQTIAIFWKVGAGAYQSVNSVAGPATGTATLTVTQTLPAGTTEAFIRLYNGSGVASQYVLYDNITVVEGTTSMQFDGETTGAAWDGAVNNSTSTTYVADDNVLLDENVVAIQLHNVVAEDFATETVQAEFPLLGRGRYIEKGDRLGIKGTLNAQIRDSGNVTARDKRLGLEAYAELYVKTALRNPFGDIYNVALGDMSFTRIAGTGRSEFVDVTIPYSEVVA